MKKAFRILGKIVKWYFIFNTAVLTWIGTMKLWDRYDENGMMITKGNHDVIKESWETMKRFCNIKK